jgi:two-component system KDP operon response regulator KdpE
MGAILVIVLSGRADEKGKVAAFAGGADDCVTKPFNRDELLARVREALRQATNCEETALVQAKNLVLDLASRRESFDAPADSARGMGPGHENDTHSLCVYIAHSREKIESNPEFPEIILAASGVGYRLSTATGSLCSWSNS